MRYKCNGYVCKQYKYDFINGHDVDCALSYGDILILFVKTCCGMEDKQPKKTHVLIWP